MNSHQQTYVVRYLEGPWDQGGLERQLNDLVAPGYELVTAVPLQGELILCILRPKARAGSHETAMEEVQ